VTSLRRQLGDDPKQPAYIETVPQLGYRMVAQVSPWTDLVVPHGGAPASRPRLRAGFISAAAAALCLVFGAAFLLHRAPPQQKSIAVIPFLDLTEGMTQETFADGMTEELIHRLSKISGLHVPAPTSSFYFKGKQITVADMAKALGVAYVLDGSVRKSGNRLRVAARLMRADNGYVLWSETYDRPLDDILTLQDEIAGEVTKALRASI
jgi:TolB-like protein